MFHSVSKLSEALSPWGAPRHAHVVLSPLSAPFSSQVTLPGSKSFTNRALLIAACAQGRNVLRSPLFSDDSYWCVEALRALGVVVNTDLKKREIEIIGAQGSSLSAPRDETSIYLGSAGTIARFLPALFAAQGHGDVIFTTSSQLARRPLSELIEAMRSLGAEVEQREAPSSFPLRVRGGSMRGGEVVISGQRSSQFISALLIAAPLTESGVTLRVAGGIVQSDYVRMTLEMMSAFGVEVTHDEALTTFEVRPQRYEARDLEVEADASTATYFLSLAAATRSEVSITNLNLKTLQPDLAFVDRLVEMGCEVERRDGILRLRGPKVLRGGHDFDLNAYSDSAPALAAIAPLADQPINICGVEHIRGHECDRLSVLATSLERAGVHVIERRDGLLISPATEKVRRFHADPHDDHRMAMALSVLAVACSGGVIEDPACVSKTCPPFYQMLGELGVDYRLVALA